MKKNESFHKVNKKGDIEHLVSSKCWCRPRRVYKDKKNGNEVWVHFKNKSKRKGK